MSGALSDEQILAQLERARRAQLGFLHVSVAGMFSLLFKAELVRGPSTETGDRDSVIGDFRRKFTDCIDIAHYVIETYGESWGVLLDAIRPTSGEKLAHEYVYEMARTFLEGRTDWPDEGLSDQQIQALARDVPCRLCEAVVADQLWRGVEREFSVAFRAHGGDPQPLPNPDASVKSKIDGMLRGLLHPREPATTDLGLASLPNPQFATGADDHVLVQYADKDRAVLRGSGHTITLKGRRRVSVFRTVCEATGKDVLWLDIIKADLERAGDVLAAHASAGTFDRPTPRTATSVNSLQRTGSRIKADLGVLGHYWHQDGQGARWTAKTTRT